MMLGVKLDGDSPLQQQLGAMIGSVLHTCTEKPPKRHSKSAAASKIPSLGGGGEGSEGDEESKRVLEEAVHELGSLVARGAAQEPEWVRAAAEAAGLRIRLSAASNSPEAAARWLHTTVPVPFPPHSALRRPELTNLLQYAGFAALLGAAWQSEQQDVELKEAVRRVQQAGRDGGKDDGFSDQSENELLGGWGVFGKSCGGKEAAEGALALLAYRQAVVREGGGWMGEESVALDDASGRMEDMCKDAARSEGSTLEVIKKRVLKDVQWVQRVLQRCGNGVLRASQSRDVLGTLSFVLDRMYQPSDTFSASSSAATSSASASTPPPSPSSPSRPTLIIAPAGNVRLWETTLEWFGPWLRVETMHGSVEERKRVTEQVGEEDGANVVLATPAVLAEDIALLCSIEWQVVIVQVPRAFGNAWDAPNPTASIPRAAFALPTASRILLASPPQAAALSRFALSRNVHPLPEAARFESIEEGEDGLDLTKRTDGLDVLAWCISPPFYSPSTSSSTIPTSSSLHVPADDASGTAVFTWMMDRLREVGCGVSGEGSRARELENDVHTIRARARIVYGAIPKAVGPHAVPSFVHGPIGATVATLVKGFVQESGAHPWIVLHRSIAMSAASSAGRWDAGRPELMTHDRSTTAASSLLVDPACPRLVSDPPLHYLSGTPSSLTPAPVAPGVIAVSETDAFIARGSHGPPIEPHPLFPLAGIPAPMAWRERALWRLDMLDRKRRAAAWSLASSLKPRSSSKTTSTGPTPTYPYGLFPGDSGGDLVGQLQHAKTFSHGVKAVTTPAESWLWNCDSNGARSSTKLNVCGICDAIGAIRVPKEATLVAITIPSTSSTLPTTTLSSSSGKSDFVKSIASAVRFGLARIESWGEDVKKVTVENATACVSEEEEAMAVEVSKDATQTHPWDYASSTFASGYALRVGDLVPPFVRKNWVWTKEDEESKEGDYVLHVSKSAGRCTVEREGKDIVIRSLGDDGFRVIRANGTEVECGGSKIVTVDDAANGCILKLRDNTSIFFFSPQHEDDSTTLTATDPWELSSTSSSSTSSSSSSAATTTPSIPPPPFVPSAKDALSTLQRWARWSFDCRAQDEAPFEKFTTLHRSKYLLRPHARVSDGVGGVGEDGGVVSVGVKRPAASDEEEASSGKKAKVG